MSLLIKIIGALIVVSLSFWISLALLNRYDENLGLDQNIVRGGYDYRDFDLPTDAAPQVCRQLCLKEDECRAFAYRRPGAVGEKPHCWLKNAVPGPSASSQFVSGVVRP
jgi:hypothetical protein